MVSKLLRTNFTQEPNYNHKVNGNEKAKVVLTYDAITSRSTSEHLFEEYLRGK